MSVKKGTKKGPRMDTNEREEGDEPQPEILRGETEAEPVGPWSRGCGGRRIYAGGGWLPPIIDKA